MGDLDFGSCDCGSCDCGSCDFGSCDFGSCECGSCDFGSCDFGSCDCGSCDCGSCDCGSCDCNCDDCGCRDVLCSYFCRNLIDDFGTDCCLHPCCHGCETLIGWITELLCCCERRTTSEDICFCCCTHFDTSTVQTYQHGTIGTVPTVMYRPTDNLIHVAYKQPSRKDEPQGRGSRIDESNQEISQEQIEEIPTSNGEVVTSQPTLCQNEGSCHPSEKPQSH